MQAMKSGSIRQLSECLEANQWRFIKAGTYLVLEKLQQHVLRRLLKVVTRLHAEANPDKASQLPLSECPTPSEALVLGFRSRMRSTFASSTNIQRQTFS